MEYITNTELAEEESSIKKKILCVDDNVFMLNTISNILKSRYEVFSLAKSSMISNFLQHTTPDLFLLDYNMPDMNGFELVPVIRSFEEHKLTPIIFLTASGTKEHVKAAISIGACDYLVKPVEHTTLLQKVAEQIGSGES